MTAGREELPSGVNATHWPLKSSSVRATSPVTTSQRVTRDDSMPPASNFPSGENASWFASPYPSSIVRTTFLSFAENSRTRLLSPAANVSPSGANAVARAWRLVSSNVWSGRPEAAPQSVTSSQLPETA